MRKFFTSGENPDIYCYPAGNYMFKVNNRNTRIRHEICSELTIKTQIIFIYLTSNTNRQLQKNKKTFTQLIKFDHTQGGTYIALTKKVYLGYLQFTILTKSFFKFKFQTLLLLSFFLEHFKIAFNKSFHHIKGA